MVMKINLSSAEDLREFMNIAWDSPSDIGVHDPEGRIADAKSILGLIALDYSQPVLVVSEDESFFNHLTNGKQNNSRSFFQSLYHLIKGLFF